MLCEHDIFDFALMLLGFVIVFDDRNIFHVHLADCVRDLKENRRRKGQRNNKELYKTVIRM